MAATRPASDCSIRASGTTAAAYPANLSAAPRVLFGALGGTATAAITLPRDSVTAREIAKNAVGSSEIRREAVRSSELEDETIKLADLADRTRRELEGAQGPAGPQGPGGPAGPSGTSETRFTEDDHADVARCLETDLLECPNVQSILLTAGSWALQAKFTVFGALGPFNMCGLVEDDRTVTDKATPLAALGSNTMQVSLADVTTVEEPTRVAVRCSEFGPGDFDVLNLKLVAVSVDDVVTFYFFGNRVDFRRARSTYVMEGQPPRRNARCESWC